MIVRFVSVAIALLMPIAAIAFTADLTLAEKNKLLERFVVDELVVGDEAIIDLYSMCWEENELMLIGGYEVEHPNTTSFNLKIVRVPGGNFTGQFMPPEEFNKEDVYNLIDDIYSIGECSSHGSWNIGFNKFFSLTEINGVTSLSELIQVLMAMRMENE